MTTINGWEYTTTIIPGKIKENSIQNEYLLEYNLAYHKFLSQLLLDQSILSKITKNDPYKLYIDCNDDEIDTGTDYYKKFKKSIFFKNKSRKIKKDLYEYYNLNNIFVKGPSELEMNTFCIDLYVKLQNDNKNEISVTD